VSVRKAHVAPIIEYGIVVIAVDAMAVVVLWGLLVADVAGNAGRNTKKEAAKTETSITK
jgi:hypothetical protein